MSSDEQRPSGKQSAKQFAEDLRDTVGKRVADNETSLRGSLGKAARWFDQKTGGKYSQQIGRAESKVGDSIGWAASQGSGPGTSSPAPGAPGASAADPAPPDERHTGPVNPSGPPASGGPAGPSSSGASGRRPDDPPMYPAPGQPGQQGPEDPPTTPR